MYTFDKHLLNIQCVLSPAPAAEGAPVENAQPLLLDGHGFLGMITGETGHLFTGMLGVPPGALRGEAT